MRKAVLLFVLLVGCGNYDCPPQYVHRLAECFSRTGNAGECQHQLLTTICTWVPRKR